MGYAAGTLPANVDTIQNFPGLECIRYCSQRTDIFLNGCMWRIGEIAGQDNYLLDVEPAAAGAVITNREV